MSGVNDLQSVALGKIRKDLLKYKVELQHYKKLYQSECNNSRKIMSLYVKCKKDNEKLILKYESVSEKYNAAKEQCTAKMTRKRKEWSKITNDCTKRRRFATYKEHIFSALREIEFCHRAEITIWVHDTRVHFSWSPSDFSQMKTSTEAQSVDTNSFDKIDHDHSYACDREEILKEHDTYDDVDYSEIYTNKGNWKIQHVRRLVHVLDCFRISHEAYHELRMVSKGHLPPIRRLSVQKKIMSEQIDYIKHPTVSI